MIEHGYYKVNDSYFNFFSNEFGCALKFNKGGNRPVFCCFEDPKIKELFWAVPTGKAENKDLSRIQKYINMPKKKIGRSFYHLGYTKSRPEYL